MRQYGQFCPLAKTLDVVGDRWTLLIVRELAIRPCRYTDLRDGLPGIATNLLADRLKSLEAAGVITAETAAPPPERARCRGRRLSCSRLLSRWFCYQRRDCSWPPCTISKIRISDSSKIGASW